MNKNNFFCFNLPVIQGSAIPNKKQTLIADKQPMIKFRSSAKTVSKLLDKNNFTSLLINRLQYTIGQQPLNANNRSWYQALAYVVRDRLIDLWIETTKHYNNKNTKRVYYLSLEFLIGRMLQNALLTLDCEKGCRDALLKLGLDLEQLREQEPDAALGNGGLGRLAACFLDSMATLGVPGFGYGIRYEYGIFNQRIENGYQVEHPENWLRYGNPWEIPQPDVLYPIRFSGNVQTWHDKDGRIHHRWTDTHEVMAMAYDMLVPGYKNHRVNQLRLWTAKASRDFDLKYFNEGNYINAVKDKTSSENLSRVLYPDDTTEMGKELRLKQEYFFVSAAIQDIVHQFNEQHRDLKLFPERVAIQLNDTHPAIAIPELMRILMDEHMLEWCEAWRICKNTFSYTNHTLMPEALETWPVALIEKLLPRHAQIIFEINQRFLDDVRELYPNDEEMVARLSIVNNYGSHHFRMAHLAAVGSHTINGVSKIHTELLRTTTLSDFHHFRPNAIVNLTNGINPRRWLNLINPRLASLISDYIGDEWKKNMTALEGLAQFASNTKFQNQFQKVKQANKNRLSKLIKERLGITINPHSMFDVHIKRVHEYKRQLLNLLHAIVLYNNLRDNTDYNMVPRTIIISGKAAPGYHLAKLIIKLINDVGKTINTDPITLNKLRLVFIPNYDVTTAGDIIPAADLSQQISLAGTEASGTGNMKLGLNGALTLGTLDGANIEILEQVGSENIFIFGLRAPEADALRNGLYKPRDYMKNNSSLSLAIEMIEDGFFSPEQPDRHYAIVDALTRTDPFLVLADYQSYIDSQKLVEDSRREPSIWTQKAILNVASMGYFSSDRAIREYAKKVWKIPVN